MNVTIICVGKLKEKFSKEAIDEYKKRLTRFCKLDIIEIPDLKIPDNASLKTQEQIVIKEGEAILSKIKDNSFVIAMCVEGELVKSEDIADIINKQSRNSSNIVFLIGGSLGLSDEVKKRANLRISFGRITLPHQLIRVVLCEQIYRAFKINANEVYHK